MAQIRPFVMWPDRRLLTKAPVVEAVTDETRRIWDDMIETMDAMPGVGLAGPQIGVMQALAVVDASDKRGQAICMANPRIVAASGVLREHEEASPNLPFVSAVVKRPRAVTVAYLNRDGVAQKRDLVDVWATSVQHQIDHLAGRLFINRLSRPKRDMLIKKSLKAQKV
jgi:peptide deformylase